MISPITDTKKVLERTLASAFPTTKIAWEANSFKPPANELYLHTQFVINTPNDPFVASNYYRERIMFQVFVCDLLNKGTGNAISVAEQIRNTFKKGSAFIEGSARVSIINTPQISGAVVTEDRLVVPVMIDTWVEVNNP